MRALDPRGLGPWLAVVTLAAAGAAAAAGYALTAPKHYRATAQILVSPVPAGDSTFTGIDVLRDSGGRRTAAASAAALVRGPLVADAVRALLGIRRSRDSLLHALHAHVVDSSDVVAVTVEDTSANGAAQLANAFADTLVNQRTASFQSEVAGTVRRYSGLLARMTSGERAAPAGAELSRRLAVLQSLQGQQDPTLKRAGQATAPTTAVWPDVPKLTAAGAGVGAALGGLVALVLLGFKRVGPRRAAEYDRAMPERELERLVDRLEARIAARESALAAREQDLQAALAELRAAQAEAAPPSDDSDLVRRERVLEQRLAAVTKREQELARRSAELSVRVREAEAAAAEAKAAAAKAAAAKAAEAKAAEAKAAAARAAEAKAAAAKAAEAKASAPAPSPAPAPAPRAVPAGDGRFNLITLERLVDEKKAEFPDRWDEWSAYLFFLREHAGPDGAVPARFDGLIQDTFGELVS